MLGSPNSPSPSKPYAAAAALLQFEANLSASAYGQRPLALKAPSSSEDNLRRLGRSDLEALRADLEHKLRDVQERCEHQTAFSLEKMERKLLAAGEEEHRLTRGSFLTLKLELAQRMDEVQEKCQARCAELTNCLEDSQRQLLQKDQELWGLTELIRQSEERARGAGEEEASRVGALSKSFEEFSTMRRPTCEDLEALTTQQKRLQEDFREAAANQKSLHDDFLQAAAQQRSLQEDFKQAAAQQKSLQDDLSSQQSRLDSWDHRLTETVQAVRTHLEGLHALLEKMQEQVMADKVSLHKSTQESIDQMLEEFERKAAAQKAALETTTNELSVHLTNELEEIRRESRSHEDSFTSQLVAVEERLRDFQSDRPDGPFAHALAKILPESSSFRELRDEQRELGKSVEAARQHLQLSESRVLHKIEVLESQTNAKDRDLRRMCELQRSTEAQTRLRVEEFARVQGHRIALAEVMHQRLDSRLDAAESRLAKIESDDGTKRAFEELSTFQRRVCGLVDGAEAFLSNGAGPTFQLEDRLADRASDACDGLAREPLAADSLRP